MTAKIPLLLFLFISFFISLHGCKSGEDISGKWVGSYLVKNKSLGDIDMKFIMNINKNFKYSITKKGDMQKHNLTKVFSRKSGVWTMESGLITFTPIVCSQANEALILEEIKCDSVSAPVKPNIIDNTWEYSTSDGRELKLVREP